MQTLALVSMMFGAVSSGAEVRLESDPPGAWLQLDGPAFVSGSTPLPIEVLPEGRYLLLAGGPGVAAVRARIHSDVNEQLAMARLAPPGSILFPPGATHLRSQEYMRGSIFFGSGSTGGIALGYAESARRDALDDVQLAADAYSRAISEEAIEASWNALVSAQQKEDDNTTMRNLWTGYLAGVWFSAAAETWLTPHPSLYLTDAGDYILALPRVGSWSAIWRGTLIPGAGQRYLGRTVRSNVTAFLTYGLVASGLFVYDSLLDERRRRDNAQRQFDSATTPAEVERQRLELQDASNEANNRNTLRWSLFGAAAAAHLWGIVDAWQVASYSGPSTPSAQPESDVSLSILPNPDGFQAALAWRFP